MPIFPPPSGASLRSGLSEATPSVAYFSVLFRLCREVCPVHSGYEKSRGVCHANPLSVTPSFHPTPDLSPSVHISFHTAVNALFLFSTCDARHGFVSHDAAETGNNV